MTEARKQLYKDYSIQELQKEVRKIFSKWDYPRKESSVKKVVLFGGTGQAKVVKPIIEMCGGEIVAVIDEVEDRPPFPVDFYRSKEQFEQRVHLLGENLKFCVTIGNPRNARLKIHNWFVELGLSPIDVIHPSAILSPDFIHGEGIQIMAGAIINPEVRTGRQVIINTGAQIDHECILEDGVEIAPGVVLDGCVTVKKNAWVASGAVVLPRLVIGENSIVGAGAVVTKDVPPNVVVVGIPARTMRGR